MQKAGQDTPDTVTVPEPATRILRAKLILEEALETVHALGVIVRAGDEEGPELVEGHLHYSDGREPNLEMVVDGCADISVVTIGTLVAFGIDDEPVLEEVDRANLRKFGPGGWMREDGKWMKPPDWTPPDILGAIERGRPDA